METINGGIISYATDYIGKREIKGNMGFKDEQFNYYMDQVGFKDGQAWCAYFAELCWTMAYKDFDKDLLPEVASLFSAGAVKTFNRFNKADGWDVSKTPVVGAVVIWQKYKSGKAHWSGHAGIVLEVHKGHIITSEGNTNTAGSREGIGVFKKRRNYNFNTTSGLRMLGFIHPKTT